MFKTAKFVVTLAVIGLSAGPALAHPGHGLESAILGHIHSLSDLGLLLGALAATALLVFIGSRPVWPPRRL